MAVAHISRRTVLKGLGVTLALPYLESMAPRSRCLAAESAGLPPRRAVFVGVEGGTWAGEDGFFPLKGGADLQRHKQWGKNGILHCGYIADTGADYKMSPTLEPLTPYRKQLLIISGLHHHNDEIGNRVVNAHGQDVGTLLTGANISATPGVAIKNGQSIDQYLAEKVGDHTRFPSLQLTVGGSTYNTKDVGGLANMGYLSYDADGYPLPVEGDAGGLFDQMVTNGSKDEKAHRESQRRLRKSILDTVVVELKRLNGSVSTEDRRKLDEYGTTVREVERRLEASRAWDGIPLNLPADAKRPPAPKRGDRPKTRTEEIRLMLDILALALQTDVTRIATLRLSGYYGSFDFLGYPGQPHVDYAHHCQEPQAQKALRAIDKYHIEQLAYFTGKLQGIKELGGNVLDNSMVFYGAGLNCSGRWDGDKLNADPHQQHNHPTLVVGGAGGALKTGRHVNYDHGTPQTNLYSTMMELMGVHDQKFSDSTGPLTDLI